VPNQSVAYLFPTFPMRDAAASPARIPGYQAILDRWTEQAGQYIPVSDDLFDVPDPATVPDLPATLNAHYACFLEGMAMAEWLGEMRGRPDVVTGYSMGLFAALCCAGSVTFEDSLAVMAQICGNVHQAVEGQHYAMGVVSGLDETEASACFAGTVEATDVYSPITIILAGLTTEVTQSLAACMAAGAEDTMLLPVSAPFHSTALSGIRGANLAAVETITIVAPEVRVISAISAAPLKTAEEVRREIIANVVTPMRWFATMLTVIQSGATAYYECGLSPRLTNVARRMMPENQNIENFLDFELTA